MYVHMSLLSVKKMPPKNATKKCHQKMPPKMPPKNATKKMPQKISPKSHKNMPQKCHKNVIKRCHKNATKMPQNMPLEARARALPSALAFYSLKATTRTHTGEI
jgi:hypothetical protein